MTNNFDQFPITEEGSADFEKTFTDNYLLLLNEHKNAISLYKALIELVIVYFAKSYNENEVMMTTKDKFLYGKHQLFVKRETDDDSRYKNLNLNQNQKCLNVFPVQSYNNSKTNYNKDLANFNEKRKESLQAWNSTNVNWKISHPLNLNIEAKGLPKKRWTKENYSASNSANNAKYDTTENLVGLVNPFEFPRQQNENPMNMFEIMAFKSSQQLKSPTRTLTELALLHPFWPKPVDSIIEPWRQCGIGEKYRAQWKTGLTNYLFSITKIPNFLKKWYSQEFKTQLSADIGNQNLFDTNQKSRFEYKDQLIQPRTELNQKKMVKIDAFTSSDVKEFCSAFRIKSFKQALFMLLRCPGTNPVFGSSILLQTLFNHFNNGDNIQKVLKQAESDFPYLEVIAGPFEMQTLRAKLDEIPDQPLVESPPPSPDKKVAEPEYMKYMKNLDRNVTKLTEIAIAVTSTNKATKIPSSEDQIKFPSPSSKDILDKELSGGGGIKDKPLSAKKPKKDVKDGTKDDTFQSRKSVVAKRADEIKKHEPVDQKRKDYKTLRCGIPSSDFDKASKIPKERATQKGGAFDRASEVETAFGFGKVEKKKEGS